MTPLQLKNLGMARGWAQKNVPDFDEAAFRLVLRNIGHVQEDAAGHVSSKALTNSGLEAVMAWFESVGWEDPWKGPNYWTNQTKKGGNRQEYSVSGLCLKYQISDAYLSGIINRITHGRTDQVSGCNAYEQGKIIEALKAVGNRQQAMGNGTPASRPASSLFPSASSVQSVVKPHSHRSMNPYVPSDAEIQQMKADEIPI